MVHEGEFRARDGRRVTYGWFGAEDGTTVVHCHGGAESHVFEVEPEWTASLGVRVVTPDRPGFSTSDPSGDRDVAWWTNDLVDLAEHLGVDEVSLIGWSSGGPHALAAGASCTDLVSAVSAVASPAPLEQAPHLKEVLPPAMAMLPDLAAADREGTVELLRQIAASWVGQPDGFLISGRTPPADQAVLDDPVLGANLRAQILEGLRTTEGLAREAPATYGTWGFRVEDVAVPVSIWHGTADGIVDVENARWLADAVPGATLHEVDGGGHFIALSHWREILEDHLRLRPARAGASELG